MGTRFDTKRSGILVDTHEQQALEREKSKPRRSTFPRMSIIISTCNRHNMVLATLASLRKQTLANADFEVIVVDNGSTDGTLEALYTYISTDAMQARHPDEIWRAQCLEEPRNGLAYARNRGVQAATGEILVFLDDDTLADPHFLEHLLNAYDETGADVISGCVELRWETRRPYWVNNNLLSMFGYYVPFRTRGIVPEPFQLSSTCFSLKREALEAAGGFIPFLSKRLHMPVNGEMLDLSRRLREAGYTLWCEPRAVVLHRITQPRLERAFIIGRAYWEGRSEVLADYFYNPYFSTSQPADADKQDEQTKDGRIRQLWRRIWPDLKRIARLALWERPILAITHQTSNEQLRAAMNQAYYWGRVQQHLRLLDRAPALFTPPALLLVSAGNEEEPGADWLTHGLTEAGVECTTEAAHIPLAWLWQHRATGKETIGIIHFYRPGACVLKGRTYRQLLRRLRLARWLGIRVVSTDVGGWWQHVRGLRGLRQRHFEQRVFRQSHLIHSYTRHPELLYRPGLRRRVRSLTHPGLRDALAALPMTDQAREHLGLPVDSFVYLCLAYQHTEAEVVQLVAAFAELSRVLEQREGSYFNAPQLLIVGMPQDRPEARKLLHRAAFVSGVHLYLTVRSDALTWYASAADACVLSHFARVRAGAIDTAMLFYSYERVVIAPDLPRLRGMLPPHACVFYDPASVEALVSALLNAPGHTYRHKEKEAAQLTAGYSWHHYAQRLLEIYKPMLHSREKKKK